MILSMTSELYTQYRSVHRPRPIWPEVGLYGGYNYIELADGLWLPRIHEVYIHLMSMSMPDEIKREVRKSLDITEKIFRPSAMQQCDSVKLRILFNSIDTFSVQGYSLAAEHFLGMIPYTKVYTDYPYHLPNIEVVSTEELCKRSISMLTLMHYRSTNLKEHIRNWGNIIAYDANTFADITDSRLIGG